VTRDEWQDEGLMHTRRERRTAWELGDWLLRGEALGYDVRFAASMALTGLSRTHLYALRTTARAFPLHVRSYEIAWGTHKELSRVKDETVRKELHTLALTHHWMQHEVRGQLRDRGYTAVRVAVLRPPSHGYTLVQVECPTCGHIFAARNHKVERMKIRVTA